MSATLVVRLQPGAAVDRIDGWDVDVEGRAVLKIRLRARPIEGEANAAITRYLSGALGLPKSAVTLARGDRSRLKRLTIEGLDAVGLHARIDVLLSEH